MSKSPSFQFYPIDFLHGVRYFTTEEVGAYVLLLCEQWDSGFIEFSDKNLKKITKISAKKLENVVKKFEIFEEKTEKNTIKILKNLRLEAERNKRLKFIESQANKGKKSGTSRRKKVNPGLNSVQTHNEPNAGASSSSISNDKSLQPLPFFEYFQNEDLRLKWIQWIEFRKKIKKPILPESMADAVENLKSLSGNKAKPAIAIISQSIANGWQGLFELKNSAPENPENPGKMKGRL